MVEGDGENVSAVPALTEDRLGLTDPGDGLTRERQTGEVGTNWTVKRFLLLLLRPPWSQQQTGGPHLDPDQAAISILSFF